MLVYPVSFGLDMPGYFLISFGIRALQRAGLFFFCGCFILMTPFRYTCRYKAHDLYIEEMISYSYEDL